MYEFCRHSRQEVKEPGELKAETVNNADGTDGTNKMSGIYNCSLINFIFCCEQCRTMSIIHFSDISNYLFCKH